MSAPMPDADDRDLIADALDDDALVEAAAGTGKTTELVKPHRRGVETRPRRASSRSSAVTFTEKAAGELKLRLREELERARHAPRRRRAGARCTRARRAALRGGARQHHPRLLRRPAARAAGRGAGRPAFEVLTEAQAERLFDEAFARWLQEQLDDPPEGVRRSLRRPTSLVGGRRGGRAHRAPARAGRELLQWRDFRDALARPRSTATRDRPRWSTQLTTFAELSGAPLSTATTCPRGHGAGPPRLARRSSALRAARAATIYDGWEARSCALARRPRPARRGKGSGAAFAEGVARAAACSTRATRWWTRSTRFQRGADADLAALLHEELRECLGALRGAQAARRRARLPRPADPRRATWCATTRPCAPTSRPLPRTFVDEFQDTDPLQAEILLLLARRRSGRGDWRPRVRRRASSSWSAIRSSRSTASAAPTSASIAASASCSSGAAPAGARCRRRSAACRRSSRSSTPPSRRT